MFKSLMKAAVGVVVDVPVAIVADSITMFGALNDKKEPHVTTAAKRIAENVANAVEPEKKK